MEDSVYVVGGGPSLEGFDFSKLDVVDTIAVNLSCKFISNPKYFITGDSGMIKRAVIEKFWGKFPHSVAIIGKTHRRYRFIAPYLKSYNEIYGGGHGGKICLDGQYFASGKNSGFCGLQYAVRLGYKRIYLLGIDLGASDKRYFYDTAGVSRSKQEIYFQFKQCFIDGLHILAETDIEVISCSSISPLNDYIQYQSLEDIFNGI